MTTSTQRSELSAVALLALALVACTGGPTRRAAADANRLLRDGRNEEALAAYREALRHSPDTADLHYGEALALYALKRPSEAEAPLRRAIRLEPGRPEFHLYLGHVLAKDGRMEEAVAAYRESTVLETINPEAWKGLGISLYNLERWAEARTALERYLSYAPNADDQAAIGRLVRSLPAE